MGRKRAKTALASRTSPSDKPDLGSALRQYFGSTQLAGDVARTIGTFNPRSVSMRDRLLMRLDPVVAFGSAIIRSPLVNMRWSIESKDSVIAAFCEQQLRTHFRTLVAALTLAIPFGYQVVEKVWTAGPVAVEVEDAVEGGHKESSFPAAWSYKKFKGIDPRSLTLLIDPVEDEFAGVKQGFQGTPVGPERLVIWSYRREDVWGQLTGLALYDQVYQPWWEKSAMNLFANRYFERRADPTPIGRAQPEVKGSDGKVLSGFQFMADQMAALKNGGILLLPSMKDKDGNYLFGIELLQDDKRGEMYQDRINALDIQILRGMLITDKAATSGDGTGSLAQATQHAEVLAENLEAHQNEIISDVLDPQVLQPLVVFNFGEERARKSQTRLHAGGLSSSMRDLLKEVLVNVLQSEQMLADGKKVKLMERIDGVEIAKTLDIPLVPLEQLESLAEERGKEPAEDDAEVEDADVADDLIEKGELDPEKPEPAKAGA